MWKKEPPTGKKDEPTPPPPGVGEEWAPRKPVVVVAIAAVAVVREKRKRSHREGKQEGTKVWEPELWMSSRRERPQGEEVDKVWW